MGSSSEGSDDDYSILGDAFRDVSSCNKTEEVGWVSYLLQICL